MLVRHSFVAVLAGASLLAACSPAPVIPSATGSPAPVASTPTPTPAEERSVKIRAAVSDRALAGAAVTVRLASDLSVIAEGLTLDAQGTVTLPLTERLQPGTVVVVLAKAGTSTLSGLYAVPSDAFKVQQAAASSEWLLDLATSAVTRKLTSKIADVMRSLPPNTDSAKLNALIAQMNTLVEKTRSALQASLTDQTVSSSLQQALQKPTSENIEALANNLITRSALKSEFVQSVDACNRQVYDNLSAGGPLVVPAPWQVFDVIVPPPQVRVVNDGSLEVTYGNQKTTLSVPNAAQQLAQAQKNLTDTKSNGAFADVNTNVVANTSSGGGSSRPPSLKGTITAGGVARANALVQLTNLDGTIVAKTASASNGAYAFYDVPDGEYYLIVAVDGAVQSAPQRVTIGNLPT